MDKYIVICKGVAKEEQWIAVQKKLKHNGNGVKAREGDIYDRDFQRCQLPKHAA